MADGDNVVITRKARQKMAKARATGTLPKIAKIALGEGGAGEDGTPVAPSEGQDGLTKQICELEVQEPEETRDGLAYRYRAVLPVSSEADGKAISEAALVDEEGDAVGIKTFMPKWKDADCEMEFAIDDIF